MQLTFFRNQDGQSKTRRYLLTCVLVVSEQERLLFNDYAPVPFASFVEANDPELSLTVLRNGYTREFSSVWDAHAFEDSLRIALDEAVRYIRDAQAYHDDETTDLGSLLDPKQFRK